MRTLPLAPASSAGLEGPPVPDGYAHVTEMFSGIQGEGPFLGVRQIFVRFGGCDLRCSWCDTPRSLVRRDPNRVERTPGKRDFDLVPNPIPLETVGDLIGQLRPAEHHSVSFTGGEPLLQPAALLHVARLVHESGALVFLETHGGRVEELESVIQDVDVISMDIKLLSSTGEDVPLSRHEEFLRIATRRNVYTKIVVTPATERDEVMEAIAMVARAAPSIPLILQPVTPRGKVKEAPTAGTILELHAEALRLHRDVRVIPQVHVMMGQL